MNTVRNDPGLRELLFAEHLKDPAVKKVYYNLNEKGRIDYACSLIDPTLPKCSCDDIVLSTMTEEDISKNGEVIASKQFLKILN